MYNEVEDLELWNGYRLSAIDGSVLEIPNTKILRKEFGVSKNQSSEVARAKASCIFDRGYPSAEMFSFLCEHNVDFLATLPLVIALQPVFTHLVERNERQIAFEMSRQRASSGSELRFGV